MIKRFEDIISTIDNGILNEESKKSIVEAFEVAVNERVESKAKIEVEEAVKQLDESHATKLQTLLEAIDQDHTNKLKKVLCKVDSDYAEKLQQVIEKYENMVQHEAITFRDQLTTEMSNYMDMYLGKMLPQEQITEAVENTQAKKIVDRIKELVSVDEDFITDTIRGALQDGKSKMETLSHELNEAIKTNIQINQDLKKTTAALILEKLTSDFDDSKKKFMVRVLSEKSPEEIKENFDYVVEMFERDEATEVEVITESAKRQVHLKSKVFDTPKADQQEEPIAEAVQPTEERAVGGYLEMLQEQDKR